MLVTLPELKQQCRLPDDHTAEDAFLTIIGNAASQSAEADLNRKLYADQAALDADAEAPTSAMVVNDQIRAGILLLAASLYENREYEVTGTIISAFDRTLNLLWGPYRWYGEV